MELFDIYGGKVWNRLIFIGEWRRSMGTLVCNSGKSTSGARDLQKMVDWCHLGQAYCVVAIVAGDRIYFGIRPLERHMLPGTTVTGANYSHLLKNYLKPAICTKWRGLLIDGVHDNTRPWSARATMETIHNLRLKCLPNPPYLPDLTPSDCLLHIWFFKEAPWRAANFLPELK